MTDEEKRRWKGPKKDERSSPRSLVEHVKARRDAKPSSKAWLERQLNDPYVKLAQAEGYRARAAYKLIELDDQFGLIKKGMRIADLGAAPGGWMQVALKRGAGKVVGVDLLPIDPLTGAIILQGDITDDAVAAEVMAALGGPPDLVVADMAANTTGHARTDQIRTGALAEAAVAFALDHLPPGGAFATKAFQGGLDGALLAELKKNFAQVRHAKPKASRAESVEIYLVAIGRK